MAATVAELRTLFPAFADDTVYTDDAIEAWFLQAPLRFLAARFGTQWDMAVYCYTCHSLTVFPPATVGGGGDGVTRGPITSERVADLSRNYGATIDLARVPRELQEFTSTAYGVRLLGIILSRRHAHARVVLTGTSSVRAGEA